MADDTGLDYGSEMVFWFFAALLTFGASLSVLLPMSRRVPDAAGNPDLEVYRDQLDELGRDVERGLIPAAEAEQARAEIGRQILQLAPRDSPRSAGMNNASRLVATLAVIAVPVVSWGIYAAIGSPDLPPQPLQARLEKNPADSSVDELVMRAEAHLAANPADGRGWEVLAPIYLRLGRTAEAVTAYRNAIRLQGGSATLEAGLGEAISAAAAGVVTAEAEEAFRRALALEPQMPKARFYLALALAQDGKPEAARDAWAELLATLPPDSPWMPAVQQALGQAPPSSGPSEADMTAAENMPAADRQAMIEDMVAGLDERLRENPNDRDGWMRLVRSYVVLGRMDAATDALSRGIAALGAGSDDGKALAALAASLGVENKTTQ